MACETKVERSKVDTVCIPFDDSPPYVQWFFLAKDDTYDISLGGWNEDEKGLQILPEIWTSENHSQTFSWKNRLLTKILAKDIDGYEEDLQADYWMYTCRDKDADLPSNEYLKNRFGTVVYGDAYIFRVLTKDQPNSESGKGRYHDLDMDFVHDLMDRKASKLNVVRRLLATLSEQGN